MAELSPLHRQQKRGHDRPQSVVGDTIVLRACRREVQPVFSNSLGLKDVRAFLRIVSPPCDHLAQSSSRPSVSQLHCPAGYECSEAGHHTRATQYPAPLLAGKTQLKPGSDRVDLSA